MGFADIYKRLDQKFKGRLPGGVTPQESKALTQQSTAKPQFAQPDIAYTAGAPPAGTAPATPAPPKKPNIVIKKIEQAREFVTTPFDASDRRARDRLQKMDTEHAAAITKYNREIAVYEKDLIKYNTQATQYAGLSQSQQNQADIERKKLEQRQKDIQKNLSRMEGSQGSNIKNYNTTLIKYEQDVAAYNARVERYGATSKEAAEAARVLERDAMSLQTKLKIVDRQNLITSNTYKANVEKYKKDVDTFNSKYSGTLTQAQFSAAEAARIKLDQRRIGLETRATTIDTASAAKTKKYNDEVAKFKKDEAAYSTKYGSGSSYDSRYDLLQSDATSLGRRQTMLDFSGEKISTSGTNQLSKYYTEVEKYKKDVESFNKKYTGTVSNKKADVIMAEKMSLKQRRGQLQNDAMVLSGYEIKRAKMEAANETIRKSVPKIVRVTQGISSAAVSFPFGIAALGVGLATRPGQTITGTVEGVKQIPSQFRIDPYRASGEAIGTIAAGFITGAAVPKIRGYAVTVGKKPIPISKLVGTDVLSGAKSFPVAPSKTHLSLFKQQKYKLPNEIRPGVWHAAPATFGKNIIVKGGKPRLGEAVGMYTGPQVSPYFLRIAKPKYTAFGLDKSMFGQSPTILRIYPKAIKKGIKGRKGVAELPLLKTEIEAVLPPSTKLTRVGATYYTKYAGQRIPIYQYENVGITGATGATGVTGATAKGMAKQGQTSLGSLSKYRGSSSGSYAPIVRPVITPSRVATYALQSSSYYKPISYKINSFKGAPITPTKYKSSPIVSAFGTASSTHKSSPVASLLTSSMYKPSSATPSTYKPSVYKPSSTTSSAYKTSFVASSITSSAPIPKTTYSYKVPGYSSSVFASPTYPPIIPKKYPKVKEKERKKRKKRAAEDKLLRAQRRAYQSSVGAFVLNIRAPKITKTKFTGLGIRPMITRRKPKRPVKSNYLKRVQKLFR